MAITLRALYESVSKKANLELIAGEEGLDNTVSLVHMVEGVAITSFLDGNEIIFTTGIALEDESMLLELVRISYAHRASGMIINIGPYIREIPTEVIDFANEHGFPLFRVPWHVHLSEIMSSFTIMINMEEQKDLELQAAINNAFYMPENTQLYIPMLKKHGFKTDWSYCVCMLEVLNRQTHAHDANLRKQVQKKITSVLQREHNNMVTVEENGCLSLVFCNASATDLERCMTKLTDIITAELGKWLYFYVGAGSIEYHVSGIQRSHANADRIRQLQKRRRNRNTYMSYEKAGLYKLLFELCDTDVLSGFYRETLYPLERYDKINETDYMYVLSRYIENDFGVTQTAEELHMHRNSVTYKMHKIEEILGISTSDAQDRMKLMIAFMIREISD